ncbi:MAG: hypothetical protein LBC77_04360 [Spirochaetaceae bacterium]|jgi:hypothetical protein|nr:hypothetical protein [Spirochaetaceae bacterium]
MRVGFWGRETAGANEYIRRAEALLRALPDAKAIDGYARALGLDADYHKIFKSEAGFKSLLTRFQKNMSLLISKTWVEKDDELRKKKLSVAIPLFVQEIANGHYTEALRKFSSLFEELQFLFFGGGDTDGDFVDFALRIDIQLGLFCMFVKELPRVCARADSETERALLALIIRYFAAL